MKSDCASFMRTKYQLPMQIMTFTVECPESMKPGSQTSHLNAAVCKPRNCFFFFPHIVMLPTNEMIRKRLTIPLPEAW